MAQLWQWKSERFNQEKHEMFHLIGIHAEFRSHLFFHDGNSDDLSSADKYYLYFLLQKNKGLQNSYLHNSSLKSKRFYQIIISQELIMQREGSLN
jgi:hypothetical protein